MHVGPLGSASSQLDDGTGMILTSSGEILTNNHVIANATQIKVTLYGQKGSYPATLVGTDPTYDVALLQLHGASGLPTVALGESSKTQVGDDVLAIGNALGAFAEHALGDRRHHLRRGTVHPSRRRGLRGNRVARRVCCRPRRRSIPGNSGGPLVDSAGQVIGMNTAAATSSAGNAPAQNIGFAIPIDSVKSLLPGLRKGGTIGPPKAFIGVEVVSVTPGRALRLRSDADNRCTRGERRAGHAGCARRGSVSTT